MEGKPLITGPERDAYIERLERISVMLGLDRAIKIFGDEASARERVIIENLKDHDNEALTARQKGALTEIDFWKDIKHALIFEREQILEALQQTEQVAPQEQI